MIHILDGQEDIILDYIVPKEYWDDIRKRSLKDTLETYQFVTFTDKSYSKHLEKRNRIIIQDQDGNLIEYVMFEVIEDRINKEKHVYANASYLDLKKASIIYPGSFEGTVSQHAGRSLNNTGWRVGIVEGKGTRTIRADSHTNPYEMLRRIANEFDLELKFRVEHDGRRITGRYVDLLERVGEWRGREVEFGKDLAGLRRIEKQNVVTALLGLGPEDEDGNRLEVLVEDEEALQRWGWIDEHGNLNHWIESYEIQSDRMEMTEEEARQYTRTALDKRINTQVTYEGNIVDLENVPGLENKKIRFGDTIRIKDTHYDPPLFLEARIFEEEGSNKDKARKEVKLGDYIEYTEEEVHAIWKQLQQQIRERVSHYEMVEYTYDKLTIDNKDETVFTDGKTFAEAVGVEAKEYAVEQDGLLKTDVERYAEQQAESALSQAKQYAVAKEVYDNQMQVIADEIADRAPIEYVDGQLQIVDDRLDDFNVEISKKADGNNVYTISQVDNMINNTVSKTQYTADMDGIVTELESQGTKIGQNEEAIGLKADKSYVDGVENSLNTKIGNVEVKADSVITSVSEVRADLDGLEIGGRNLLRNSSQEFRTITLRQWGAYDQYELIWHKPLEELGLKNGDYITLSMYFDDVTEEKSVAMRFDFNREDNSYINSTGQQITKPGRYSFTAKIPDSQEFVKLSIRLMPKDSQSNYGYQIKYKEAKLEKGNKATDWTPAPEDMATNAQVTSLTGEITALAGEVNLKASRSEVNSLENRVSTAESTLQVLPDQINAKVDDGQARSIFQQEASSFTFSADQINFDGHVFGKNATFDGELRGATGTFSGKVETSQLVIDNPNISQDGSVGLRMQVAEWRPDGQNPFVDTGYIEFNTLNNGLEVNKYDRRGNPEALDYFEVYADHSIFLGEVLLRHSDQGSGTDNGIRFEGEHIISEHSGDWTFYGNRAEGYPFKIRSHNNRSSYRNDFWIDIDGLLYTPATYDNTSSNSSNVRISYASSDGKSRARLYRTTSARKYKRDIQPSSINPYDVLELQIHSWVDKKEYEDNNENIEGLKRYHGFIADDVAEVAPEFAEFNEHGEVENYNDRIFTLLFPIIKKLVEDVEELKNGRG